MSVAKIFIVDYESQADRKVYFVDYDSQEQKRGAHQSWRVGTVRISG